MTARGLRYGLFGLLFAGASVPIYLGTAAAELALPGAVHRGARLWGQVFLWLACAVLGIRLEVRGARPTGAAIVAAKHQSFFETVALLSVLDSPAVVLKRELLALPLWRFLSGRHQSMPVDREQGAAALRAMLKSARAATAGGRALLIFPEGTRVVVGDAPPLKPGVSALYALLRLPVVPLALDTGRVWPPGDVPRAGTAVFAFGDAIAPGLDRTMFEARLHAAINALQAGPGNA